jgi:hypothetical protein
MLLHEAFGTHAALDVDLRLSSHDNEQQTGDESPSESEGQHVIGQRHAFPIANYLLKHPHEGFRVRC